MLLFPSLVKFVLSSLEYRGQVRYANVIVMVTLLPAWHNLEFPGNSVLIRDCLNLWEFVLMMGKPSHCAWHQFLDRNSGLCKSGERYWAPASVDVFTNSGFVSLFSKLLKSCHNFKMSCGQLYSVYTLSNACNTHDAFSCAHNFTVRTYFRYHFRYMAHSQ